MVDQQKFHRRFLCGDSTGRFREDLHALRYRLSAGRNRLRYAVDVDKTHTAIRGDTQFFVIAKPRNIGANIIGHFDDHLTPARFDRLAVNFNVYDVVTHSDYAAASVVLSTMLRPLLRTMYSNSWW